MTSKQIDSIIKSLNDFDSPNSEGDQPNCSPQGTNDANLLSLGGGMPNIRLPFNRNYLQRVI